eukprot:IDg13119t1
MVLENPAPDIELGDRRRSQGGSDHSSCELMSGVPIKVSPAGGRYADSAPMTLRAGAFGVYQTQEASGSEGSSSPDPGGSGEDEEGVDRDDCLDLVYSDVEAEADSAPPFPNQCQPTSAPALVQAVSAWGDAYRHPHDSDNPDYKPRGDKKEPVVSKEPKSDGSGLGNKNGAGPSVAPQPATVTPKGGSAAKTKKSRRLSRESPVEEQGFKPYSVADKVGDSGKVSFAVGTVAPKAQPSKRRDGPRSARERYQATTTRKSVGKPFKSGNLFPKLSEGAVPSSPAPPVTETAVVDTAPGSRSKPSRSPRNSLSPDGVAGAVTTLPTLAFETHPSFSGASDAPDWLYHPGFVLMIFELPPAPAVVDYSVHDLGKVKPLPSGRGHRAGPV